MTDKKFLIVVDMQKDFVDGALGSPQAQAIVPAAVRRIRLRRAIVRLPRRKPASTPAAKSSENSGKACSSGQSSLFCERIRSSPFIAHSSSSSSRIIFLARTILDATADRVVPSIRATSATV